MGITCAQDSFAPERRTSLVVVEPDTVLSRHDSVRLYQKPDALRAVWMGAIVPGYGQIYNRSYWKLPIVYSAFFGCAFAITRTNGRYNDYKTAYRDIYSDMQNGAVSSDPTKTYIAILPEGYTLDYVGGAAQWRETLKSQQNNYHRYRDLSIVATVAVYALSLIDAYVDAQLFDFDISPDLSAAPTPDPMYLNGHGRYTGVKMAVRF